MTGILKGSNEVEMRYFLSSSSSGNRSPADELGFGVPHHIRGGESCEIYCLVLTEETK